MILASLLPLPLNADSPDDLVVFVNVRSSVSDLSVSELKQIFLKKKTRWPNGEKIDCLNQPEGSLVRQVFRTKILGMTDADESTYWQNQKIRSQMSPPIQLSNTPKAVFRLTNAVSYAFRKDLSAAEGVVKIILVVP